MKTPKPLDEHEPLVLVARMFRSWRYRGGTQRVAPTPFRRIACLACRWHPIDQVAYELGLSVPTLRSWHHEHGPTDAAEPCRLEQPLMTFVPIPVPVS